MLEQVILLWKYIYDSGNYKYDDALYNSCFYNIYSETRILYIIIDKDKDKNEKYIIIYMKKWI